MKKVRVFFIYLLQKKQVLLKSKSLSLKTIRVLQRILTIFVKSKELSTAVWAGLGPTYFTAFTTVFYGIQPPSQSSKDVGRFHVAVSQHQVAITGQQGTLNNPSIFCKEKGT